MKENTGEYIVKLKLDKFIGSLHTKNELMAVESYKELDILAGVKPIYPRFLLIASLL